MPERLKKVFGFVNFRSEGLASEYLRCDNVK